MYTRPKALQDFVDATGAAFCSDARPVAVREFSKRVFALLTRESDNGIRHGARFPACKYLDNALEQLTDDRSDLGAVARSIKPLESFVGWQRRTSGENGSVDYIDKHVNGMIIGPGGMESRYDVQVGFSLLAPATRYPDHRHPPEEAYLLLTDGEFKQADGPWFSPGVGGGLYNMSNILHAMKSTDAPFLAMWCLLT
ncbi:dimethylsulfonioproprionate lyase family protein [Caballeronia sordidicola]|uniref:dimethylsulfonioproprionate lyase family protein n=1 Tax=Caballeronia sordidicola TaxID=196367 RepID=UPI000B78AFD3|nr:dimethylsulfonioproprionate lyase family protein [Caballeronia sordidicola]